MIAKILQFFNPNKKELKTMSDKVDAHKAVSLKAMEALKLARAAIKQLQAECGVHSDKIVALEAKIAEQDAQMIADGQVIEALTFAWDAELADNGGSMGGITE
jgi:uncharacterized protein involved in exopolysaccharide biosynthesis